MKKLLRKLLIGLFCIGMLASCGSDEEIIENADNSVTHAEISEEAKELENEEIVEFIIIEDEEETVPEKAENESPVVEEVAEAEVVEETAVREIPEVNEPEYSYVSMSQTMYASNAVNVRNLPDKDGDRVGGLSAAQEVKVIGRCNETGWYKIEYDGKEAYVSDSYLVNEKPVQKEPVRQADNTEKSNSDGGSVTVPTYEDTQGNLVWVPTKGGKKYHSKSGCSGMEGPMQVTVERAVSLGFTPCKRCY